MWLVSGSLNAPAVKEQGLFTFLWLIIPRMTSRVILCNCAGPVKEKSLSQSRATVFHSMFN